MFAQIVKDIQLRLEEILAEISTTLRLITADVSREVYKTLQPIALQFYITTETAVWTVVKELLGNLSLTFVNSPSHTISKSGVLVRIAAYACSDCTSRSHVSQTS